MNNLMSLMTQDTVAISYSYNPKEEDVFEQKRFSYETRFIRESLKTREPKNIDGGTCMEPLNRRYIYNVSYKSSKFDRMVLKEISANSGILIMASVDDESKLVTLKVDKINSMEPVGVIPGKSIGSILTVKSRFGEEFDGYLVEVLYYVSPIKGVVLIFERASDKTLVEIPVFNIIKIIKRRN